MNTSRALFRAAYRAMRQAHSEQRTGIAWPLPPVRYRDLALICLGHRYRIDPCSVPTDPAWGSVKLDSIHDLGQWPNLPLRVIDCRGIVLRKALAQ